MQSAYFEEILDAILAQDTRFSRDAYHFVRESLDFTQRQLFPSDQPSNPAPNPENRHVTGQQLLEGLRDFALQTYGPMALTLLESWGVKRCEDIGDIVFNLVDHGRGMFGKTDNDTREDFRNGFNFQEAFTAPFLPSHTGGPSPKEMREA